jgi:hypothetical protein
MFPSKCAYLFMILWWAIGVQANCQFWDGTAPFCSGSCPSGCRTVARSNCGNGACCWTGHKALCQCCSGPGPCTPTQTATSCYGVVLVCKNQQVTLTFQGPVTTTCSTYACGICFGFSFLRRNVEDGNSTDGNVDSCTDALNVRHIDPMLSDITVQGNVTLSEKEIEEKLVSKFGPRLTHEQMKDVRIVRVLEPDLTIKGDDCK